MSAEPLPDHHAVRNSNSRASPAHRFLVAPSPSLLRGTPVARNDGRKSVAGARASAASSKEPGVRRLSIARIAVAGLATLAVLVLMALGASGKLAGTQATAGRAANASLADSRLPVSSMGDTPSSADQLLTPGALPKVDLEGDEVSPALATYGIDHDGNLFEVHSPQTEEPKLASPVG
jgi:hypothetical protein